MLHIHFLALSQDDKIRSYNCLKTDANIVIDGYIDNYPWTQAPWSEYFLDIEGSKKPDPEYNTRMKILWSDSSLYFAAKLEEPHIWATLTERESVIYRDNDFEIFIDPDSDGLNYYEFEINAFGTEWDLFLPKPYNKKGKPDISWNIEGIQSAVKIYGTINKTKDTDSFWTVEIAMPWKSLIEFAPGNKKPENGDIWRMNFSRVEWNTQITDGKYIKQKDENTGLLLPENNWVWSPQGAINMHIPEKWGYVKFSDSTINKLPDFWIWAGANKQRTSSEWDSVLRLVSNIGIKGLLLGADTSVLNTVIPIANKHNIDVHAWFWTMNRGDADPSWLSVNQAGRSLAEKKAYVGYYKFMCPALPEVKNFLLNKIDILSRVDGLKGIHMDYIRYVDAILPIGLQPKYNLKQDSVFPEYDYGYHPYMRKIFNKIYGYDPLDSAMPDKNQEWLEFRLGQLNETVELLRKRINENNLISTAAVFPTPEMSKRMVRQEWDQWHLDSYFPMVYFNFYNESSRWVTDVIHENNNSISPKSKIICGLYLPALKNNYELTKAMEAAFRGGADGISFFDLNALDETLANQIKNFITQFKSKKIE